MALSEPDQFLVDVLQEIRDLADLAAADPASDGAKIEGERTVAGAGGHDARLRLDFWLTRKGYHALGSAISRLQAVVQTPDVNPSGGLIPDATEAEVVGGGQVLNLDILGAADQWHMDIPGDNAITQALIDGLVSAQSEAGGWNAVARPGLTYQDVTRYSDTLIGFTLPAFGSYAITADETITIGIPSGAFVKFPYAIEANATFRIIAA
jgi:hypothetical protein